MASVLLIDVGSTSIKYRHCSGAGREEGSLPFPPPQRADGYYFEADAVQIAETVKGILRAYPARRALLSVQMHGHVLSLRGDTYVSWRDRRSLRRGAFSRFEERYAGFFTARSGTASKPNLCVYSLLEDLESGLPVGGEVFSLGSYIVHSLTGRNISHVTDLCALGFYTADAAPNEVLLRVLPYRVKLPRAVAEPQTVGEFEGCEIVVPFGDQQCSVAGVPEGALVLNIGTAAQLCCILPAGTSGEFESRPFFGGRTLCTRSGLPGGAALAAGGVDRARWLREYAAALAAFPRAGRDVWCLGGAFEHYGEWLFGLLRQLGCVPHRRFATALDGLELLNERFFHG